MTLHGHFEQIGLERGLKQGLEQGLEQGRKEGILQEKQHLAVQLIKEGLSFDKIAKLTSLNKQTIIELEQHD